MDILQNLLYIAILFLLPALVNRKLAITKDRNVALWVILVFVLSWWSTLILAILPPKGKDFITHTQAETKPQFMVWRFLVIFGGLVLIIFILAKFFYH